MQRDAQRVLLRLAELAIKLGRRAMSSDELTNLTAAAPSHRSGIDEMQSAPGFIRPHWQAMRASFDRLGNAELSVRAESSRRILAEHGVTCYVNRGGMDFDEPWQLDLMPLVISAADWQELEAGLIQRANLLNLMLADLYGTQRLVRDGFIPAPLVYANPGYLRPCQALLEPGHRYLQSYAADLARLPDGRWHVLADRTQAPDGLGFALENRSVLSRVLPEVMLEVQPRPVCDMLRLRSDGLRAFGARQLENPTVILLTPGPRHSAYFAHVYLARLLGLTLVEGDDLTVRDRSLFIKSLDGLRRVDVVLRRVNDAFCDPLELRSDSVLGVPGLVEAARAGQVSISNALGTGLLECPAFMPFLPSICRHLLQDDLLLPSLATWWCGQARDQDYVREHLDELSLVPAFHPAEVDSLAGRIRARDCLNSLTELRLRPHELVAQEIVPWSRTPVGPNYHDDPLPFVLRAFVLHDGTKWTAMAGGLARIVGHERGLAGRWPAAGLSKDVWILPDGNSENAGTHHAGPPALVREGMPSDLPSRAAENFYWLGRYTERLEQIARLSRCVLHYLAFGSDLGDQGRLIPLQGMLARLGLTRDSGHSSICRELLQQEILLWVSGDECPGGARDVLRRIHFASFSVRDRLSADTWRILNRLETNAQPNTGRSQLVPATASLHQLVLDLAAFSGMEMENTTRGYGWVFLDLGRRLERGVSMARLMEAVLGCGSDRDALFEPALEISDSVMTHRRRYFAEPSLASTTEVLVEDASNPRSLAFQVTSMQNHAAALPKGTHSEGAELVQSRIVQLAARLREQLPASAQSTAPATEIYAEAAAELNGVSELLTQVYFSHVRPQVS
jgi:uncharacterized circularly permuted ATP-grasp superfamily protein/uncharacterized alpha-E superfamily protein